MLQPQCHPGDLLRVLEVSHRHKRGMRPALCMLRAGWIQTRFWIHFLSLKYHQKFKVFSKEKTEYRLAGLAQSGGLSHSLKTRHLILF